MSRVDDPLKALLGAVSKQLDGALALVSGRPIHHLDELFAPLRVAAAGLHGVERRDRAGTLHGAAFMDSRLNPVRSTLAAMIHSHPKAFFEEKGRAIAMHFRQAPELEPQIRRVLLESIAQLGPSYHIQEGNQVLEIKPSGFSKGTAIKAFLREQPFAGRTPVFLGDDLTDLDGFRMVEERGGMSIAVGDRVRAQWHLKNPSAVRKWLQEMTATDSPEG